jgi:hypothetical protein
LRRAGRLDGEGSSAISFVDLANTRSYLPLGGLVLLFWLLVHGTRDGGSVPLRPASSISWKGLT